MKKRIMALISVCLIIALTLSACGGNEPTTTTPPANGATGNATAAPETPTEAPATPAEGTVPEEGTDDGGSAEGSQFDDPKYALLDEHFPGTDLGGITLAIDGFGNPENENEVEAAKNSKARDYVEQKFNIKIVFEPLKGIDWNEIPNQIVASVAAGSPIVNIMTNANAGYWFPTMAAQDVLVEFGDFVSDNFPPAWYRYFSDYQGRTYGFATGPDAAWSILAFNRDLLSQIGMEKTPQDMFIEGKWSLEDFYNYCAELKTLLPEGSYPIGLHVTNWQRGAAYANGGYFKNPATNVPGYLEEAFLEPARTMQQLIAAGLHVPPGYIPEPESSYPGGNWSFGDAMGNMGEMFSNGQIAMHFVNSWSFEGAGENFDFGIVPFPWGSNVQFPASGDWHELKDAGVYKSFSNDASTTLLIKGTPEIVTPEIVKNIVFSFNDEGGLKYIDAKEQMDQGIDAPLLTGDEDLLFTALDAELWNWYRSNAVWEPLDAAGTPSAFYYTWYNAVATGTDLRSSLEAVLGEDVWTMYQAGLIKMEDVPESVRVQAEEFGATVVEEEPAAEE